MLNFLKSRRDYLQLVLFMGFYGLFHVLYFQIPDNVLRDVIYYHGVVAVCADFIHMLAPLEKLSAFQNHLVSPRADLEIVRGCDGAGALFLLIAAVLAFPANFRYKLLGLVLGISLIYILNMLRIGSLYYIINYHSDWFHLVHTYLAPTLLIVLACLFFAWWAWGSRQSGHEPS